MQQPNADCAFRDVNFLVLLQNKFPTKGFSPTIKTLIVYPRIFKDQAAYYNEKKEKK